MNKPKEETFILEVVHIIRPTSSNQVFNESRYIKVTDQYDVEGIRTVFLREKNEQTPTK